MFLPLLAGLATRLILAPWTEQRWDSYVNRLIGAYVLGYGINPLFPERSCSCLPVLNYSYPPVWLMIILPLFFVWNVITSYAFPGSPQKLWAQGILSGNLFEAYRSFVPQNLPLLDLLFKTPLIVSDLLIGYFIWNIGGKTRNAARISAFAWLLNPYVIIIGSVWGEFDTIAVLFLLLSVHYLVKHRTRASAIFLAVGTSTKLFPGILLVPILIYLFRGRRADLLGYVITFFSVLTILFSTLLIFPYGIEYIGRLLTGRLTPNQAGADTFSGLTWMVIFNIIPSVSSFPMFLIMLPVILIPIISKFYRSAGNSQTLFPFLTASLLAIYLSYPAVNVQYLLWALPMLAVLLARKSVRSWLLAGFSLFPLAFLFMSFNPLYLVSPTLIWDETNHPPYSDVVFQVWHFPPLAFTIVPLAFTAFLVLILRSMLRSPSVSNPAREEELEVPDAPSPMMWRKTV